MGGGLPGRNKAAMTVKVRLDPCKCLMQLMMLKHLYTYSVYAMWLSLSHPVVVGVVIESDIMSLMYL